MSPVTILIDARYCRETSSGVGNYCRNLLNALDDGVEALGSDICLKALFNEPGKGGISAPAYRNIQLLYTPVSYTAHPSNEFWLNVNLPRLISEQAVDIYHNLAFILPFMRRFPARRIVSLHDLIVFDEPGNYPFMFRHYLQFMIRRAIKRADKIIAFSKHVNDAIFKRFPVSPDKTVIIPHGVTPVFRRIDSDSIEQARAVLKLPERFIFSVGSSEPRKNVLTLLKGYRQARQEHSIPHKLIIAVSDLPRGRSEFARMANSLGLTGDVEFIHIESAEMMNQYYNAAEFFVFPTRSEGFGFPVLEAMACGTPVLCSGIPPLLEIAGRAASTFDPDDFITLAKKMYSLSIDEHLRRQMAEDGLKRAESFTWKIAAEKYLTLYSRMEGLP